MISKYLTIWNGGFQLTIRDLEIFVEVCTQMSMSKAAQKLYISPSSVSQSISALENEYNTKLFERLSKKLYLTSNGKELLFHAKQLLYDLGQMNLKMRNLSYQGLVRIGVCTTIGHKLIYPILEKFQNLYPSVNIQVEIGNSSYIEQKILSYDLDVAIIQMESPCSELTYVDFLDDKLMLVCHPENPLAEQTIKINQLSSEPVIAREPGSRTQKMLQDIFDESHIIPNVTWICKSIDSIKEAVIHNKGIALLSQYLIQDELKNRKIAKINLEEYNFTRKFYISYHKNKHLTEYIHNFIMLCSTIKDENPLKVQ
ncbi:LysR family transcriptional regulator [Clostridium sp. 2-1]|nr:LysR family transcriptional regulator [Clostridium beijerinckii]POO92416.1 LysR family transcriptional regulator [Clostridium sp. 2-1]MBN7578810.1 LysR family transcriptional regulator [Clostridium beijerinckii]MBN7583246.1 LysR family transcriptional regulator [Clostridium beijerinckii]MBO0519400.1 LysR family transcriptional regulator [Clostridium beijerinckii]